MDVVAFQDNVTIGVHPAKDVGIRRHLHACRRYAITRHRIAFSIAAHVIAVRDAANRLVARRRSKRAGDRLTGDSPESRPTRLASDLHQSGSQAAGVAVPLVHAPQTQRRLRGL